MGLLHFVSTFDKSFTYKNQNNLSGDNFSFSSISYKLFLNKASLTGELSYNNYSFAAVSNLNFSLNEKIELLVSYRNYSPSYFNLYANGFGEYSNTQNEIGYYLGTKIRTIYGTFNFYYDIFKSPNKSFKSDFPASGNDFLINYNTRIFKNTTINLKIKREEKEVTVSDQLTQIVVNAVKSNYKFELKYTMNKLFYGKTRFELVEHTLHGTTEIGFLTYQELKYKIKNLISISARIIIFETDSYNSRLYEFENDLRGVMTNIPMFGEGLRWYLLINYQPIKPLNLYIKYSETYKPNLKTLSSGNSEIIGNVDNRISFQIDYNF